MGSMDTVTMALGITGDDRDMEEQSAKYIEYSDGELVFEEGSKGKDVYFIVSGRAEVSQLVDQRKSIVSILHKNSYFGEMAALNDGFRTVTVKAMGELHVYELSLDDMLKHMQRNHELLRDIFATMVKRVRDTNLKIKEVDSRMLNLDSLSPGNNGNAEDWMTEIFNLDSFNIAVVHGNENNLSALKNLLQDKYNVFTATDGHSALDLMRHNDIPLIISASRLPDMSGMELLGRIRMSYPDTIRIVMSSYPDHKSLMKTINSAHIHEAFLETWNGDAIEFTISKWTRQYRKNMELEERARRCKVLEEKLESANDLILELMQDLMTIGEFQHQSIPFWQRWFGYKGNQKGEELPILGGALGNTRGS